MLFWLLAWIISAAEALKNYQLTTPRKFFVDPSNFPNIALSGIGSLFRLGSGGLVKGYSITLKFDDETTIGKYTPLRLLGIRLEETSIFSTKSFKRPVKPLELYEFEGCPFCRKVREAITTLDLDVLFYPCPKGGPTFRSKVMKIGGKAQFPYLVDPNTGISMYESDEIIAYLCNEYGDGEIPQLIQPSFWTTVLCSLASLPRIGKGNRFQESKPPKKPIVLWAYEASPYCKVVRERLVELEIPHLQKTAGRGSPKKQEMLDKVGRVQLPYIEDPNTGVKLFESSDIINYLNDVYAVKLSV